MRIKVLRNLGRDLPPYKENQVVDVEDAEGERLIKLSLAVQTDEAISPGDIQSVSPRPSVAESRPAPLRTAARSATTTPATPETIGKNPHDKK